MKDKFGILSLLFKARYGFFKYHVSVKGFDYLTEEQIDDILNVVINECDKYFQHSIYFFKTRSKICFKRLINRN